MPRREPDRDSQRSALSGGFDLDRAQPVEHAPRDGLAPEAIRAGQQDEQLAVAGSADAVEVAQLRTQRPAHVGERALGQLGAVLARELLEISDRDEQAGERRPMPARATDLLLHTLA